MIPFFAAFFSLSYGTQMKNADSLDAAALRDLTRTRPLRSSG
jgi:hypothetical protein